MTMQRRTTANVVLMVLVMAGAATAQTITLHGIDGRQVTVRTGTLAAFAPSEAQTQVDRILEKAGVKANFTVSPTDDPAISNAAAMLDEQGTTRYILYAPKFMEAMSRGGQDSWAATGVLAHEIGHHLNFHTMNRAVLTVEQKRQQELDADEFAGTQLAKLGATQADAISMLAGLPDNDSATHPRRSAREVVVLRGWCATAPPPPPAFASAKPTASTATCADVSPTGRAPTAALLAYDFTKPGVSLPEVETDRVVMGSGFGGFAMFDKPLGGRAHTIVIDKVLPPKVELEASAYLRQSGPEGAGWGIGFGGETPGSPSYLVVMGVNSRGGSVVIYKAVGRDTTMLGTMRERAAVRIDSGAVNTMTVRLNGTTVEVLVNGVSATTEQLVNDGKWKMLLFSGGHEKGRPSVTIVYLSARATAK